VHVFTSGDEAELFLNGKSLGRKKKGAYEYRLRWDNVAYEPGILKVVAYRNDRPWATDEVHTADTAARLRLAADRASIHADGTDLSFITVTVTDAHGVTAPLSAAPIHFELDGPGEIVATDNGDPTDMQAFPSHDRRAFHGKCLVIVRSLPGQNGKVHIRASSPDLDSGTTTIVAEE
jgi:beta-galactosidase